MAQRYCVRCGQTMNEENFYRSNNTEKYPDGFVDMCKECLTSRIDNFDPSTYLPILEELDVPYIPEEWASVLRKYADNREKLTGKTILGRYLSKMKLKKWKDYRWKDTEYLQQVEDQKKKIALVRQGYSQTEIDEILRQGASALAPPRPDQEETSEASSPLAVEEDDDDFDLTEEDKRYLRLKWGKNYRTEDQISLEQLYTEMLESYDIETAGDKNTLILACKASLKANQLLNIGDIDGAQKATKMYDSLMKSGKWTAAQNKADLTDEFDSIGALVALCETDGFIPRYYVDGPQDKVDKVLLDNQKYVRDLVTQELGLGALIENAVKSLAEERERIAINASEEDLDEDALFDYDKDKDSMTEEDYKEFSEFEEELRELDAERGDQ